MQNPEDDLQRLCHTVAESAAIMQLLSALSQLQLENRLIEMRGAVNNGDYARASRLEAEAGTWEQMPGIIQEQAHIWAKRHKG